MTEFSSGPSEQDVLTGRENPESLENSTARLALLLRVSESLLTTDDPDEAVGRLAQVIVPQLADWSFITVLDEDGGLRDVGLAHSNPARLDDLRAYSDRHLQNMTDAAAVAVSLRTERPVVVPHLNDDVLKAFLPDPEVAYLTRRLDPHGVAVFPLQSGGRTFGVLTSVTTSGRGSHATDELSTLLEVSRRAGPVLGAARAAKRARTVAETMQRSLLRVSPPGDAFEVAVSYRPAYSDREVGGDWYDVFTLDDGSTVVTIGDVMGHDLAAIAAMAQLRSFMRAYTWNSRHSPAEVLAATDSVSDGLGPGTFATAFTIEIAPPIGDGSARVRWANAGHPPPAVISPDGQVSFLGAELRPDPALGVDPYARRHDHDVWMSPGTVLVLYTDGLVERRDRSLDDGFDQLAEHLSGLDTRNLTRLLDDICVAMDVSDTHDDDIALLAVRIQDIPALGTPRTE